MKSRSLASLFLVAALAAVAVGMRAADAPAKPAAKPDKPAPADVQKAIDQFNAKRDAMIADRQAMLDRLKNATAEDKKAILDQMQAQQKDLLDAQRALGRQIRDELRKLRQSQPPGGNR
jgi:hypothetical protein